MDEKDFTNTSAPLRLDTASSSLCFLLLLLVLLPAPLSLSLSLSLTLSLSVPNFSLVVLTHLHHDTDDGLAKGVGEKEGGGAVSVPDTDGPADGIV